MWLVCKRLTLGVTLIALASGLLLFSDLGRRTPARTGAKNAQKTFEIFLFSFVENPNEEDARTGFIDGLRDSGMVEGRDFRVTIHNAQGDMAILNGLADAALASSADLICTLSTPALQAAVRRVRDRPVVFTLVANPMIAGAGRSETEHLANFTGAYVSAPVEDMMTILRACAPNARRIGTLFVPAEVNSVFFKDRFIKAAEKAGFASETLGVTASAEVPDAASALCARGIDLFCQIPDNLSSSTFPSIAQAAKKARIPLFSFASAQGGMGSAVVLARDYRENGRDAGRLAARVLRGESPASMPFKATEKMVLVVNLEAARHFGLNIPPDLVKRADEVIGK
jgi:ABC-type uncharacterized transport system substrate-binding protein